MDFEFLFEFLLLNCCILKCAVSQVSKAYESTEFEIGNLEILLINSFVLCNPCTLVNFVLRRASVAKGTCGTLGSFRKNHPGSSSVIACKQALPLKMARGRHN